jgi:hypothetical protein
VGFCSFGYDSACHCLVSLPELTDIRLREKQDRLKVGAESLVESLSLVLNHRRCILAQVNYSDFGKSILG